MGLEVKNRPSQRVRNSMQIDGKGKTVDGVLLDLFFETSVGVWLARGASVPTDTKVGFIKGCIFIKTDGGVATTFYINEGDESSCDFNVGSVGGGDVTGITTAFGLLGTAASGDVTITPGVSARNETGGTLVKGTLVRIDAGYSTSKPLLVKADADAGLYATHVVSADIANNANGDVYALGSLTGLATNGQTIGDKVYLSATAGGFTFTAPTGADQVVQEVGIVVTVDASTGTILFFPGLAMRNKLGTSSFQDGAITPVKLAASEALTATADGTGTGAMSGNTSHAVVTSASATNQISLPASSAGLVGKSFTLWVGANGFELITPAASNATINTVDSDGTNQADIPANTLSRLTLVNTDTWLLESLTALGAVATAIVPDND